MKLATRLNPVLDYTKNLMRELDLVADRLPQRMTVTGLHWGGGTPTTIPSDELMRVMDRLNARFNFCPTTEIAFELDPRTFETRMAQILANIGVTRVSLGVQEFDARVQEAVNRIQPFEVVKSAVEALRKAGVSEINFVIEFYQPSRHI